MKPFSRSVIELFDGKKRYVIPMFQRQYVWREDRQLGRMWEDLKARTEQRLDNKATSPHFLGAIVISLLPTFGRKVQAYDVVDGQQRLTTFQVLLNAFRDVARALESEFADELSKYIVNEGIMEDKAVERYKVWPTQVDRPQMKALVDCGSQEGVEALEKAELGKKKTGVEPIMITVPSAISTCEMTFDPAGRGRPCQRDSRQFTIMSRWTNSRTHASSSYHSHSVNDLYSLM